jgi:hypothetical protein
LTASTVGVSEEVGNSGAVAYPTVRII